MPDGSLRRKPPTRLAANLEAHSRRAMRPRVALYGHLCRRSLEPLNERLSPRIYRSFNVSVEAVRERHDNTQKHTAGYSHPESSSCRSERGQH